MKYKNHFRKILLFKQPFKQKPFFGHVIDRWKLLNWGLVKIVPRNIVKYVKLSTILKEE